MLLGQLLGGEDGLHTDKLVAALLEAGNDLGNQTTLDTIGLCTNNVITSVHTALYLFI